MDDERRDTDPVDGGGEWKPSVWRTFSILMVGAVPIVFMARGWYLALDLPKDSNLAMPGLWTVLVAAILARPKTFRDMTIAAAIGVTVGAFAMLCYLPVALYSQSFEIWSQGFMIRTLALLLFVAQGWWITALVYRRLAVPAGQSPAKDET